MTADIIDVTGKRLPYPCILCERCDVEKKCCVLENRFLVNSKLELSSWCDDFEDVIEVEPRNWFSISDSSGIIGYGFTCPGCKCNTLFADNKLKIVQCEHCGKDWFNP